MLFVERPPLPAVSVLNGGLLETVILCRFVSLSGKSRSMGHSQRQVLSHFNRSGHGVVKRCLAKAQVTGILTLKAPSYGVIPDVYVRGDFFSRDSRESRALVTLAGSLWGKKGLLTNWPYSAAWGFGCVPPAAIICLATLFALEESISQKSLRNYLSTLVAESSFTDAMKFLKKRHMTCSDSGRILIAPDWEEKLQRFLDEHPECNERKKRGDTRRKAESWKNKVGVQHGRLTDAERNQLFKLPCVVNGCKRRNRVQEHFPPKKFLKKNVDVSTNRHFVWSICRQHNDEMKGFIARMPLGPPIPSSKTVYARGVDPLRAYKACANLRIQQFYRAFHADDLDAATDAVRAIIGLWKAILLLPDEAMTGHKTHLGSKRKAVGKRPYSPGRSQLPYRAEEKP